MYTKRTFRKLFCRRRRRVKREETAVGTLDAYSFVTKRTAEAALDLHRLVHFATRNWIKKQELLSQRTPVAITCLLEVFRNNNPGNRSKLSIGHLQRVVDFV